jgi:hypothetical protein
MRLRAFALFMSVFYIACGCVLLFTDALKDVITQWRTAIGAVLVGYGLVRLVIWYVKRPRS